MKLHEEYIVRNNIQTPIVLFNKNSNLFLKTKNSPYKWRILKIKWFSQSGKPGFFEFTQLKPLYNCNGLFASAEDAQIVYWDEYESALKKTLNKLKLNQFKVVSGKEKIFMIWEMFVYMCDGHLSERMKGDFYKQLEISTSLNFTFEQKNVAFQNAIEILKNYSELDSLLEMFNYRLVPMIDDNSQWLENLYDR